MSNNENKNEQFKSLKEIETFIKEVSRPFVNEISTTKNRLKDLYDKIYSLKQEKIQQSLNIEEEDDNIQIEESVNQTENEVEQIKEESVKTEEVKETASQKPVQSEPAKSQTYINP